jgi:hypothetical protein
LAGYEGVDLGWRDDDGVSLLELARREGVEDIVRMLREEYRLSL